MNPIAEEIYSLLDIPEQDLAHYGTPRHSGRYPWGSGEDPYQRNRDFMGRVELLKKSGWKDTAENIKKEFGLTTSEYRSQLALGTDLRRMDKVVRAESLRDDGLNPSQIGKKMGINESSVRSLLDGEREARMMQAFNAAEFIKSQIDKKGVVDVGGEVNRELGISKEKMDEALTMLKEQGYVPCGGRVDQGGTSGQKTTLKLMGPPGTPKSAAYDYENIHSLNDYVSHDGGETFHKKFTYPSSLDSKRLQIRYKEDGGEDMDGIVELRRGVADLSLGESRYSQVRILVDGTHYIKGMAVYSDDMPDGVDVRFNTNKSKDVSKMDVLKKIKSDPDNPFGSAIKDADQGGQYWYDDPKTGKKKLGLINKRADEGDWTEWKDSVPSQFLSKQALPMAKKQLKLAIKDKQDEFDEINSLTNPTIKKHLLSKFADECDSAAVHLQAAALPGQKYHVIIPVNTLKDTEVYAPGYDSGTKLALVRYPHGGTFEIPILTVNNKNATAKKLIGNEPIDAVCINKKVADRLSGADFDGDTVMCIPTHDPAGRVKITSTPPLKGLEGFDPKMAYGGVEKEDGWYRGDRKYKTMSKGSVQNEMGRISNLITDMTLLGASDAEKARAVRHSMVVIDAYKHHLDYKQSEHDNGIAALKKEYQKGGASTIISRAKREATVDARQGSPRINIKGKPWYDASKPEGSLIYKTATDLEYTVAKVDRRSKEAPNSTIRISDKGKRYIQFDGDDRWTSIDGKNDLPDGTRVRSKVVTKTRTQKSTEMAETDDAYTLVSTARKPMEVAYAEYANTMKAMANQARITMGDAGKIAYNANAKRTYAKEVQELEDALNTARLNAPRERMAIIKAKAAVEAKKRSNPDMSKEEIKKTHQQTLTKYREEMGSVSRKARNIKITDRQWEAIQAGAISEDRLKKILNNADIDELRQRATPKTTTTLSSAKVASIKAKLAAGYTLSEVAKQYGLSTSTISKYAKGAS